MSAEPPLPSPTGPPQPNSASFGTATVDQLRQWSSPAKVSGLSLVTGLVCVWVADLALLQLGVEGDTGFGVYGAVGTVFVSFCAGLLYWFVRYEFQAWAGVHDLLRAVAGGTTDALYVKDRDGKYLLFNDAAARFFGRPVESVLGKDDMAFFDEASAAQMGGRDRQVMESGVTRTWEETLTVSGVTRTYLTTRAPYRNADGKIVGVVGISRDITSQRRAEEELRASESRYRTFVDHASDALFLQGRRGIVLDVNRQACESLGYTRDELIGKTAFDFDPVLTPASAEHVAARLERGETFAFDSQHRRKDGVVFPVEIRCRPFFVNGERLSLALVRDMTERVRREEDLRKSHAFQEALIHTAGEGILVCFEVPEFPFLQFSIWNDQMVRLTGYTLSELNRLGWSQTVSPDPAIRDRVIARMARMREGDNLQSEEWEITRKDGARRVLTISTSIIDAGDTKAVVAMMTDVTHRKESEQALRDSEARYRTCVDHAADALFLHGARGVVIDVNRQACESLGYTRDELIGKTPFDYDPELTPALMEELGRRKDAGETVTHDSHHRRKDGTLFPVEIRFRRFFVNGQRFGLALARDMTERKRAEDKIRTSEARMAAAQRVAGLGVWEWDCRETVWWSEELYRIYGRDPATFTPSLAAFMAHLPGEAQRDIQIAIQNTLEFDAPYRFEHRMIRADGAERWLYTEGVVERIPDGRPVRLWGVCQDITERKRAERELRASEERHRLALDAAELGTWQLDCASDEVWLDHRCQSHYGLANPRISRTELSASIHPDDATRVRAAMSAAEDPAGIDGLFATEHRIVRPDGSVRWLAVRARVHFSGEKADRYPTQVVGTTKDITVRKLAESAERGQSRVLERIAIGAPLGEILGEIVSLVEEQVPGSLCSILVLDREGLRFRHGAGQSLPAAYNAAIDGVAIGPTVGSCGSAAYYGRTVIVTDIATDPLWDNYRDLALAHGLRSCWSVPIFAPAGGEAPTGSDRVLGTFALYKREPAVPEPQAEAAVASAAHLAGVAIGRENAIQAIRESEARYGIMSEITRSSTFAVRIRADGTSVVEWVRPRCGFLSGYMQEEINAIGWPALFPSADRDQVKHALARMLGGETIREETRLVTKDGVTLSVLLHGKQLEVGPRPGEGVIIGGLLDITDLKATETARRRSEDTLRRAQAIAHVGSWSYDVQADTFDSSDEGARICGWSPAERHSMADLERLIHPDDLGRVQAAWQATLKGGPYEIDHRLVVYGQVKWVYNRAEVETDHDGRVVRINGVTQDVTARRKLEERFQQSHKMESIGRLAGGVAHDFNNLLTVINGYSELLLADLPPNDPQREPMAAIRDAGERAAGLTSQLLAFSRKAIVAPKILDLNDVVSKSEKLLRRLIGEDIRLTAILNPTPSRIKADPGQLEQVVMNLALNARDAMPTGGRLTIETRTIHLHDHDQSADPGLVPGHYVQLTVTDTGRGMTDEVRANLFEPFFTTKGLGKGTGLGLAVVHGVVLQSGGHIRVETEVGVGTTFKILFPVIPTMADGSDPAGKTPRIQGTETVLLVEDEDAVRRIVRLSLESQGYSVLVAGGSAEAIRVAEAHAGSIDLLVTDVVMPEMGGRELVESLRARRPGLRVLYMSGYTDDAVVRHGVVEAIDAFIQKPFTPLDLAGKVRVVLDARA